MGKKDQGSSQINSADQYYQQLANESNQMFSDFQGTYFPVIQKLLPELQDTVEGKPSALMNAAMAPVNAQTSRLLNTIQNNIGGVGNPNALFSDIALSGQQNAGLAADQTLSQALSAISALTGQGYQGVGMGMSGLGNAAGGEANLGLNLNQQGNQWWQSLLGGVGEFAGMGGFGHGGGGGGGSAPFLGYGSVPTPAGFPGTGDPWASYYSAPISSGSTMGPRP